MVATTSSLVAFTLDVDDIIQKAYRPIGGEHISAEDAVSARLSLNLILIELQNKNIPLNKIDTVSVAVVADTTEYALTGSVSDVLKINLKETSTGVEIPMTRYSQKEYHQITKKTLESRPNCYTVERLNGGVTVKIWPVQDTSSVYTMELLVYKKIEDVTASYQKLDLPYRYLPLIIRWLSYELSLDRQGITPDVRAELKNNYKETLDTTFEEDRERADFIITPGHVSGL